MLDSIYHLTLKSLKNHISGLEKGKILPSFMQRYNGPHKCTILWFVTSNKVNTTIQINATLLLYYLSPASKQAQQYRSMPLYYCMVCHQQQIKHNNTDQCHFTTVLFVTSIKASTAIQINATLLLYYLSPASKQAQQYRSMPLYYCIVCHRQQSKHSNTDICHCTTLWFFTINKATTIQINATLLLYCLSPTIKQAQQYRSMPLYYCMVCHQQQSKHSNTDICHCTTVWFFTINKATTIQINATLLLYCLSPTIKQAQQYRSMPLYYCMVCHQQQSNHNNTDQCLCTTIWFVSNNKASTAIQINATVLPYGLPATTK